MTRARRTETVVVGGGQAGLVLSRYLGAAGADHVVLERGRIGERWLSERWDSLTLLTPNWMSALPGCPHAAPDDFLTRDELVRYLGRYAARIDAPVHEHTAVTAVEPAGDGFLVRTDAGSWRARNVVLASGDASSPRVPDAAADAPPWLTHRHSGHYRSPAALRPGGVLVVGAGPTGQQVALELARAGRSVHLAVGRHTRALRRYRGRDLWAWLAALGHLDETVGDVSSGGAWRSGPSLVLSGAHGGEQLDLGVLREAGVRLTGRLIGFDERRAYFAGDLGATVATAERGLRTLLARIDDLVERTGPPASDPAPVDPVQLPPAPDTLDLRRAGITNVIWATGYARRTPWLRLSGLGGDTGPAHRRGVTTVPGLYVLGHKLQYRRSSHMIGGVGRDAEYLAARIAERAAARRPAPRRRALTRPRLVPA